MTGIKKITFNGMGIALFVVFTLCLQVPVFQNYYLCLGYVVMAVYSYYFGTFSGTIVGSLGVILYCMLTSGLRGMPGWALGNVVIGLLCGVTVKKIRNLEQKWLKALLITIMVIIATAIGILVVKSFTEVILYGIPFWVRVSTNSFAFVADIIVLLLGYGLCIFGENRMQKTITIHNS